MNPLGSLIDWIAAYGVLGLFAIGLAERFVPAPPSYGVPVAIGIAAVDDALSIVAALFAPAWRFASRCSSRAVLRGERP